MRPHGLLVGLADGGPRGLLMGRLRTVPTSLRPRFEAAAGSGMRFGSAHSALHHWLRPCQLDVAWRGEKVTQSKRLRATCLAQHPDQLLVNLDLSLDLSLGEEGLSARVSRAELGRL